MAVRKVSIWESFSDSWASATTIICCITPPNKSMFELKLHQAQADHQESQKQNLLTISIH